MTAGFTTTTVLDKPTLIIQGVGDEKLITPFKPKDLLDWYPLDARYVLRYTRGKNKLYIAIMGKQLLGQPSYEISSNFNRAHSKVSITKLEDMFIENVYKDNLEVIKFADKVCSTNFSAILKDYPSVSQEELSKFYVAIDNALTIWNKDIQQKYAESKTIKDYISLQQQGKEDLYAKVYASCSEEESSVFRMIGKVYTLLSLIRKYFSI